MGVPPFLYQMKHQNTNQKGTWGRQWHRVMLSFRSPFFDLCFFSYFLLFTQWILSICWVSGMPGHVCQHALTLLQTDLPLAVDSDWVCYLNSNTSRQVWQISRGRRRGLRDIQKNLPTKELILREEREPYLYDTRTDLFSPSKKFFLRYNWRTTSY